MKRVSLVLLATIVALGIAGCSPKEGADSPETANTTQAEAAWTIDDFTASEWTIAKQRKSGGDWEDYEVANTLKFLENGVVTLEGPSFSTVKGSWRWDEASKEFSYKLDTGKYWLTCEELPDKNGPTASFVANSENGSALEIVREGDVASTPGGSATSFANPTILDNEYVTITAEKLFVDGGKACFTVNVTNNSDVDFFLSESDLYVGDEKATLGVLSPGTINLKAGKKGTFNFFVTKSDGSQLASADELYSLEGSYTIYGDQDGKNVSLGKYPFTFSGLKG